MAVVANFTCVSDKNDYITIDSCDKDKEIIISTYYKDEKVNCYYLDIPTAIKLSKTIRTHINLVKGI